MKLPHWTQVVVEPINGKVWVLKKELKVHTMDWNIWTVPIGTLTDFASSRVFRLNLLSLKATYSAAAILHDWMYQNRIVSRSQADAYFMELLDAAGVSSYEKWKAFSGVRVFGWLPWILNNARK